ncbi:sigma-54 interaction domain-containing protein [Marinisporobacter balticus]|uniref:Transcriptional regulator with PAS, ATPase and Fis domain n=1 Tax=Marinisporobacter balticus TaxID=2018667 RepID=A0A4R2KJK3_9FIRM|nr:sigma 54-interacting transcriptional regulator [Marinisporobacter balticus]TCO73833.1 transcriptional regulator with PAS, ATPase and Fis domain [Marinisporobacter balticus]
MITIKKTLAIVSYNPETVEIYYEQMKSLFSENLTIEKFCIGTEEIQRGIQADMVLMPSFDAFEKIKKYIKNKSEIVIANRTISKSGLEKIMNMAEGTQALLLDESSEMAVEMISVVYQLGARHVELIPIDPTFKENIKGRTMIILGKSKYIPDFSGEIINIGSSLLDINTIIDIGVKLGLDHLLNKQNIKKTYRESVTTNFGLAEILGRINRFESELDILLQVLDDGMIGINSEGIVYSYNESAEKIIGNKKQEVLGKDGLRVLDQIPFKYVLRTLKSVKEELIKINGYDVIVSVDPIIHSDRLYGAVAIFKKFSDTEEKQHKLRVQLIGKGHKAKYAFEDILGSSESIHKCRDIAKRMAKSNSSILISGESGTGKELFAHAIHKSSKRKDFQFVAVNCGAFPESLLESELFGYEEGAFTGARKGGKLGLFELAHKGTLFLDEMGEMPLNLQKRLLRVLQEREVMRVGGDRLIHIDIRIIAATNRDLKEMVKRGEFREDLYFRLNVLPLNIPPLRSRQEDILLFFDAMRKEFNSHFYFTPKAEATLLNYSWKGNVRELRNCIEYLANLELDEVDVKDLPFVYEEITKEGIFDQEERRLMDAFLEEIGKNISKYIFVLEQLNKSYHEQIRLGRRSIYQLARQQGLFISEQEIRRIFIDLEKFLMVEIFKGRSGTTITDYGMRVFKYLRTN